MLIQKLKLKYYAIILALTVPIQVRLEHSDMRNPFRRWIGDTKTIKKVLIDIGSI